MSALIGHALAATSSWPRCRTPPDGGHHGGLGPGRPHLRAPRPQEGFLLGACAAFVGALAFALGVWEQSFGLYCLAAVPAGLGFGIGQHYRFAAAELASPAARPRAIALVMAGGVFAAIARAGTGQTHARTSCRRSPSSAPTSPSRCSRWRRAAARRDAPAAAAAADTRPTPLRHLMARPVFIAAVVPALVGYGSMNLMMAATPLEMMLYGYPDVDDSIDVIRLHVIAMFAPGFVTGRIISRFGAASVIVPGGVLTLACAGVAMAGDSLLTFTVALGLLGVGWNFMFVGATALLATGTRATKGCAPRPPTTSSCSARSPSPASLRAPCMHPGWIAVNAAVVLPVLAAIALVLWHRWRFAGELRAG